ncbi:hypothetical protein RintRC_2678 [Richelia intracellularis]|nr:hypothetical protein RintRC_2678 [Richelia intracellularis]
MINYIFYGNTQTDDCSQTDITGNPRWAVKISYSIHRYLLVNLYICNIHDWRS